MRSIALKFKKPHNHPNAQTEKVSLIKKVKSRYGNYGLAEVYVQLKKCGYGYKRSYGSMVKQIREILKEKIKRRVGYAKHKEIRDNIQKIKYK